MHPIYFAALVSTILSLIIWGYLFVFRKEKPKHKKLYLILFLLQLPISFLLLTYIRDPFTTWLVGRIGENSPYFIAEKIIEAPVVEEIFKLWPLILIPFFWKKVTKKNALKVGLALGIGFGTGEIWTIAHMAALPDYASIPWYQFYGFAVERFIVVFLHGAFTGIGLYLIKNKSKFYILLPMALHALLNAPIFIKAADPFGWMAKYPEFGNLIWGILIMSWIFVMFIIMVICIFQLYGNGKKKLNTLIYGSGETCPNCGKKYKNPSWLVNLIWLKYKKCPKCGAWHKAKKY